MKRFRAALLAVLLVGTPALPSAAAAQTPTAPAAVQLTFKPAAITKGQNTLAQINARPNEVVGLYGRPNAAAPWKLIRSDRTAANGYKGWVVAPGDTTTYYARPIGAPQTRNSTQVTVRVSVPAPACSATAVRKSFDDSAQCMFQAYKRGDWAAVSNYALPPVVAQLKQWRAYDVETRFPWRYSGCRTADGIDSSSGIACNFYNLPVPGDGMIHGVALEFGMDRHFRAEHVETYG